MHEILQLFALKKKTFITPPDFILSIYRRWL